jgi:hypothetical protein
MLFRNYTQCVTLTHRESVFLPKYPLHQGISPSQTTNVPPKPRRGAIRNELQNIFSINYAISMENPIILKFHHLTHPKENDLAWPDRIQPPTGLVSRTQ